jgi:hypothetical protein
MADQPCRTQHQMRTAVTKVREYPYCRVSAGGYQVRDTQGRLTHRTVFRDPHGPENENEENASLGNGRHRPGERTMVSQASSDVLTPLDVEIEFRIPRSSQKKGRAKRSFAPYFRVGRRVYYRRCALEAWIADQEQQGGDYRG